MALPPWPLFRVARSLVAHRLPPLRALHVAGGALARGRSARTAVAAGATSEDDDANSARRPTTFHESQAARRAVGTLLGDANKMQEDREVGEEVGEGEERREMARPRAPSRYAATDELDDDEFAPRVPKGSMHVGTIEMPEALQRTTERAIVQSGLSRKEIFEDAEKLSKFIANRGFEDIKVPHGVQRPSLQFSPTRKYSPRLVYSAREALAYLVARQPHVYANTARVLHEIYMRDPLFEPTSMLDFGSGVGTAVWAASEIFGETIKEYTMVDSSLPMITLAEQLLTDHETKQRHIPNVHMRQFVSPSPNVKHDLVVSAYTLCEFPDQASRLKILETLWSKTRDMLVLVEDGSPDAFQFMLQARDFIIQLSDWEEKARREAGRERRAPSTSESRERRGRSGARGRGGRSSAVPASGEQQSAAALDAEVSQQEDAPKLDSEPEDRAEPQARAQPHAIPGGMHVFGPCPHEKTCPRFNDLKPCHFPQRAHFPQAQVSVGVKRE